MKIQSEEQYNKVKNEFDQMARSYSIIGTGPVSKLQEMSEALRDYEELLEILKYEQSTIKAGTIKQTLKG